MTLTPGDRQQMRALLREEAILLRRTRRNLALLDTFEAIGSGVPAWLGRAAKNDSDALASVHRRFGEYLVKMGARKRQ